MRTWPGVDERSVRTAIAFTASAVFVLGLATAASRSNSSPPARSPEEAARELFEASLRGDCDGVLSLMTSEFREQVRRAYHGLSGGRDSRRLLCLGVRAEEGTRLHRIEVRERSDDAAVVVMVTQRPDSAVETGALPFRREGSRWLNSGDEAGCADPPDADADECRTFELPS